MAVWDIFVMFKQFRVNVIHCNVNKFKKSQTFFLEYISQ